MEERLNLYRRNEKLISQYQEDIAQLEQDKIQLDDEIKISGSNIGAVGSKNKKSYVKNNIEPQAISREKELKKIDNDIRYKKSEISKLVAYQNNTRIIIKCSCGKIEQDVIRLRYFENYRPAEIAKEVEITENAVQKIISRVLKKIKA